MPRASETSRERYAALEARRAERARARDALDALLGSLSAVCRERRTEDPTAPLLTVHPATLWVHHTGEWFNNAALMADVACLRSPVPERGWHGVTLPDAGSIEVWFQGRAARVSWCLKCFPDGAPES